jgi:hypothetical protein
MKTRIIQWFGIAAILGVGIIHFLMAPIEYEEARYIGILFGVNFLASLIAAFGILRGKFWGWALGLLIAVGSLSAYVVSRTLGMPGMELEAWFGLYDLLAMALEIAFILLASFRPWESSIAGDQPCRSGWTRYKLSVISAFIIVLMIVPPYLWSTTQAKSLDHSSMTVEELQRLPLASFKTLEDQYGVQVSLVAVTAMDSIVDVRLKILDVKKANQLLGNHTAILVNDAALIPSAHMHQHALRQGKIYVIYYPNSQNVVKIGTPVSLVIGNLQIEPVAAQ